MAGLEQLSAAVAEISSMGENLSAKFEKSRLLSGTVSTCSKPVEAPTSARAMFLAAERASEAVCLQQAEARRQRTAELAAERARVQAERQLQRLAPKAQHGESVAQRLARLAVVMEGVAATAVEIGATGDAMASLVAAKFNASHSAGGECCGGSDSVDNPVHKTAIAIVGQLFDQVDVDGSGFLDNGSEGKAFLRLINTEADADELNYHWRDLLRVADTNGDGRISKEELVAYILHDIDLTSDGTTDTQLAFLHLEASATQWLCCYSLPCDQNVFFAISIHGFVTLSCLINGPSFACAGRIEDPEFESYLIACSRRRGLAHTL